MKKFVILALVLSLMAVSLFSCGTPPKHFTGQWNFSKITKVEISPDVGEDEMALLKEAYVAEDVNGVEANAMQDSLPKEFSILATLILVKNSRTPTIPLWTARQRGHFIRREKTKDSFRFIPSLMRPTAILIPYSIPRLYITQK